MSVATGRVAIIGAGLYGLAAAAHLRAVGVDPHVFGEAMSFWDRQMPKGMLLRSLRPPLQCAIFAADDPMPGLLELPLLGRLAWNRRATV